MRFLNLVFDNSFKLRILLDGGDCQSSEYKAVPSLLSTDLALSCLVCLGDPALGVYFFPSTQSVQSELTAISIEIAHKIINTLLATKKHKILILTRKVRELLKSSVKQKNTRPSSRLFRKLSQKKRNRNGLVG